MDQNEKISILLDVLQHMRKRPGMYFSTVTQADCYLRGFYSASHICLDLPPSTRYRATVTIERGWTWSAVHPWNEMRNQGMDDAAIIDEMLAIEIEVWKRAFADLDRQLPVEPE